MRTLVIVNPQSRGGVTGRRWKTVEERVRAALGSVEVERTRAPRDAERLSREGVRAGIERIVVAGGDGTLSEVVTGLLAAGLGRYARIGLLPLGTGGDFVRTLGVPRDLDQALACITADHVRRLDAARVRYLDDAGRQVTVFFVNVASLGISGQIVQAVASTTRAFGGSAAFLIGTVRTILRYRSQPVTLRVDGETLYEGPLVLAAAANGRYFGGGMHVAPRAEPDDAALDVVVVPALGRLELLRKLPRIYGGKHIVDPSVRTGRGRVVEADAAPGTVRLEIDGEPLGTLPARIEIVPDALSFVGPAA